MLYEVITASVVTDIATSDAKSFAIAEIFAMFFSPESTMRAA